MTPKAIYEKATGRVVVCGHISGMAGYDPASFAEIEITEDISQMGTRDVRYAGGSVVPIPAAEIEERKKTEDALELKERLISAVARKNRLLDAQAAGMALAVDISAADAVIASIKVKLGL